jgi:hypothetical protein
MKDDSSSGSRLNLLQFGFRTIQRSQQLFYQDHAAHSFPTAGLEFKDAVTHLEVDGAFPCFINISMNVFYAGLCFGPTRHHFIHIADKGQLVAAQDFSDQIAEAVIGRDPAKAQQDVFTRWQPTRFVNADRADRQFGMKGQILLRPLQPGSQFFNRFAGRHNSSRNSIDNVC